MSLAYQNVFYFVSKGSDGKVLEMSTLGHQPVVLGGFFSAVEDEFLPGMALWTNDDVNNHKIVIKHPKQTSKWSSHQSLEEKSAMKFHVYYALVTLAGTTQQIDTVYKDMDTLKSQFIACPLSNEQFQKLLKLLHEVLRVCKRSEEASTVMIELLGTYTTENASQAREETHRCIVASLADPNTFLLDH